MPPSAYVTVTSGVTGSTASEPNIIQNDYIIVVVGAEGTANTKFTVTDSASPATSFSEEVSSNVNEGIEIWCGQYTAASGSDTVTVATRPAASYSFRAIFAAGLTSCSPNVTQTNHGSSGSPSVASFTPVTGDFCEAATSDATGSSSSAWTIAIPFNSQGYYANSASEVVLQSKLTSGTNWVADSFKGDWDSSYGATTAAFTSSANSSPLWDEAVACFPTYSTGDEMFQGRGFFARGSSTNPNLAVQAPLHNDYIIAIIALPVPSVASHVTSVTDAQSDTYTQVVASGVHDDVEMWISHYSGTSGSSIGQLTFNLNNAEPAIIGNFEISGISLSGAQSTWASETQIATASGTANSASVASFTPDTGDICISVSSFNDATSGATFSTPANQPFQQVDSTQQTNSPDTSDYFVTAFRSDWPASTSTTATFTPSAVSAPAWDEIVGCFPGSVVVPVTCSMTNSAPAATLTLSESSGNGLSPTTVPCDGNSHNITVDPSVTLTATEPADGATSRYRFSGLTTTVADTTCAGTNSGICPAWSFTNYEQLQNTYTASPRLGSGSTTWDYTGTNDIAVSYTSAGSPATCYLSTTSGGGAVSCSNLWVDYDTMVTFGTLTVSSTEQWVPSADTTSYVITTGGSTLNGDYSRQWQVQFAVAPSSTYGSITPSATAFYNDTSTVGVTGTANPGYSFSMWSATTSSITFASSTSPTTTATIGAAGTITANFVTLSLSESVADVFAFSGTVARSIALVRAPLDAFPFGDLPRRILMFSRTPIDSFQFLAGAARSLLLTRDVADAFPTSESVTRLLDLKAIASDVYSFADSSSVVSLLSRAASDAYSFADSVVRNAAFGRTPIDSFQFLAGAARSLRLGRGASDSFPYSGSVTRGVDLLRATEDYFATSESALRSVSLQALASDAFDFGDSVSRTSQFARAAQDSFSFLEGATHNSFFERAAADTFRVSDAVSRLGTLTRGVSDAFLVSDSAMRSLSLSAVATDIFPFADSPSAVSAFSRAASDLFSFADSVTRNAVLGRAAVDYFHFSDSASAISGIGIAVSDSFSFLDSAARSSTLGRAASDAFPVAESAGRLLNLARSSADSFLFSDSPSAIKGIVVQVGDSFMTLDSAARHLAAEVSVSDNFSVLSETLGRVKSLTHLLHEYVKVSDSFQFMGQATRGLRLPRAVLDSIFWAQRTLRGLQLPRGAGDSYLFGSSASRALSLSGAVRDLINLVETGLARLSSPTNSTGRGTSTSLLTLTNLYALLILLVLAAMLVLLSARRRRKESPLRDWS